MIRDTPPIHQRQVVQTPRSGLRPGTWAPALLAALMLVLLAVMPGTGRAEDRMDHAALDTAMDAVLVVHGADLAGDFLGSAFLWGDGAVAVSAARVVGNASHVDLIDRHGQRLRARVIARDPVRDVALIAAAGFGRHGLQPGTAARLGQTVWALGAPLGAEFSLTRGMVSAQARQVEPAVPLKLLQHDAPVNPGSSGGPLLDARGQVLGMNTRIANQAPWFVGLSYALGVPDLLRVVDGLAAGTLREVPELGLRLRAVDRQIAAALGRGPGGLLVDRVLPGEAAARAGLRAGDIVLSAGGAALVAPGDLAFAIDAALTRGAIDLVLWRGDGATEVVLILDASDAPDLVTRATLSALAPPRAARGINALGLVLDTSGRVVAVVQDSPAHVAGMAPGDRIEALNGTVCDIEMLHTLLLDTPALLRIRRGSGTTLHVVLDPYPATGRARGNGVGANSLDPAVTVF